MEIFVIINEQKLKAVLAKNSSAKALYKDLEKGDIIINAKDYGGFEKKAANFHRHYHEMMSKSLCKLAIWCFLLGRPLFWHTAQTHGRLLDLAKS